MSNYGKAVLIFLVGCALTLGGIYAAARVSETQPFCRPADVQRAIIETERPKMGPIEVEFWRAAIQDAADKAGIPQHADVLTAKIAQESNFDRFRVSTAGAKCAAQIMPMHYKQPSEIYEIESCLALGAKIFAAELKNCSTIDKALRCYYSGPTNSKKGTLRLIPGYDLGKYSDAILARVYLAKESVCNKPTSEVSQP